MAMKLGKIPRTTEVYTKEEVDGLLQAFKSPLHVLGENWEMYLIGVDASGSFYCRRESEPPYVPQQDGSATIDGETDADGTVSVTGELSADGTLTVEV